MPPRGSKTTRRRNARRPGTTRRKDHEKDRKRRPAAGASNGSKRARLGDAVAASKSILAAIARAAPRNPGENVTRAERNLLVEAIKQAQGQLSALHEFVEELVTPNGTAAPPFNEGGYGVSSSPMEPASAKRWSAVPRCAKPRKTQSKKEYHPLPLSFDKKQALSEAIGLLPQRLLCRAMQIIREAVFVDDNDDEIELDIDELDPKTQRKLNSFVLENVKKKRKKQSKKLKKTDRMATAPSDCDHRSYAQLEKLTVKELKERLRREGLPTSGLKAELVERLSAISVAESEPPASLTAQNTAVTPPLPPRLPQRDEKPSGGWDIDYRDDDSDDDSTEDKKEYEEEVPGDGFAGWLIGPSSQDSVNKGLDHDKDERNALWEEIGKEADASKAFQADRAKQKEQRRRAMEARRRLDMGELRQRARAKLEEEEAERTHLRKERERETEGAKEAARKKALEEIERVERRPTVDIGDFQRKWMEDYEKSLNNDNCSVESSPSSVAQLDFDF